MMRIKKKSYRDLMKVNVETTIEAVLRVGKEDHTTKALKAAYYPSYRHIFRSLSNKTKNTFIKLYKYGFKAL